MIKNICITLGVIIFLLIAANFKDMILYVKQFQYLKQEHSDIGISITPNEELEFKVGHERTMPEKREDGMYNYFEEPRISFWDRLFCFGGIGRSSKCSNNPVSPYYETWTNQYGAPDDETQPGSVAKLEYERKFKTREEFKRVGN